MTQIDDVVKKLFGHNKKINSEHNSIEFMKQSIKNAPNTISKYYDHTPDRAIKDFLFEQTDISKQLKKLMETLHDGPEEENT